MSELLLQTAVRVVRTWTRLYTAGLPAVLRDRRRGEIESDLWECRREPRGASVAGQLLLRCLLGMIDDLAWRNSSHMPSRITRTLALAVAAAGVLAAGLLFSLGRVAVLPAPVPLVRDMRAHPQPPPPPPPPCAPRGSGRTSPAGCQP